MVCIYCSGKTEVTNSRPQRRSNQVWRRRHCLECGNIFTTIEASDLTTSLLVRNKGNLEPFQRDKLLLSVYECLRHRNDAIESATALTMTISSRLLDMIKEATVSRDDIVSSTLGVLKNFDHAAFVQYEAYHPIKG